MPILSDLVEGITPILPYPLSGRDRSTIEIVTSSDMKTAAAASANISVIEDSPPPVLGRIVSLAVGSTTAVGVGEVAPTAPSVRTLPSAGDSGATYSRDVEPM